MNKKQSKLIRKGYKDAGSIYWTADMEKAIRKIHARAYVFGVVAAIEAIFILGFILRSCGVL